MPAIVVPKTQTTKAQDTPAAAVPGAKHICIDIETADASEDDIFKSVELFRPRGKDDTAVWVEREEHMAKKRKKAALMDAAPIMVLGNITESAGAIFHCIPLKKKQLKLPKISAQVVSCNDERGVLLAAREWLDKRTIPETVVSGFNILSFDLPKIRNAYLRHRLVLPKLAQPEAEDIGIKVYDVMRKYLHYFTTEDHDKKYITLEAVCARLGLPRHKDKVDGEKIPGMIAAGNAAEVITYNWLDLLSTYEGFLAMTGSYTDQNPH